MSTPRPQPAPASAPSGRPTDAVLVAAARGGERWAKEALFRRHAPMTLGLARRLLGSDADVDDAVQEAHYRALTNLTRLKEPGAFAGWLAGIVVRRVQTRLRQRALLTRLGLRGRERIDPDVAIAASCPPDVTADLGQLYGALGGMSTQARLVLVLRRVEGHTVLEIAALLNSSPSTVKRRLAEAEQVLAAARGAR